jgi:hypothetical protein
VDVSTVTVLSSQLFCPHGRRIRDNQLISGRCQRQTLRPYPDLHRIFDDVNRPRRVGNVGMGHGARHHRHADRRILLADDSSAYRSRIFVLRHQLQQQFVPASGAYRTSPGWICQTRTSSADCCSDNRFMCSNGVPTVTFCANVPLPPTRQRNNAHGTLAAFLPPIRM